MREKKNSYQLVIVNNRNHTFYSCIKSEIQKPAKNKIFRDKSICEKIIFIEKKKIKLSLNCDRHGFITKH